MPIINIHELKLNEHTIKTITSEQLAILQPKIFKLTAFNFVSLGGVEPLQIARSIEKLYINSVMMQRVIPQRRPKKICKLVIHNIKTVDDVVMCLVQFTVLKELTLDL